MARGRDPNLDIHETRNEPKNRSIDMKRLLAAAAVSLALVAPAAQAADCGKVIDELSQAISGNLTMSGEKKASMMRMASMSYDHCMMGDSKHSGEIRDMIMTQIKESLGGR